ncbi:unnamed protein product [Triticum turgidum subsp. durum]|uniref:Uncharacterized protein n=1 Tax=Triticum turgidum subsp. durum TaxID=4567 RepID=A0A9R1PHD6_TRITD|nr:unnamed protein product [Triticum turgidum subsp. durum]
MARLGVALLALLAAAAAVASLPSPASAGELASMLLSRAAACDGEMVTGAGGAGEALRRSLVRKSTARYISYAALRADQIPCDKRGASYYINCGSMQQANPYTRGCSAITHCARNMN